MMSLLFGAASLCIRVSCGSHLQFTYLLIALTHLFNYLFIHSFSTCGETWTDDKS